MNSDWEGREPPNYKSLITSHYSQFTNNMRKVFVFVFVFVFLGIRYCGAQEIVNYQAQCAVLFSEYAKDPSNIANLVELSTFYAQPDNPQYSLPQAYNYICKAETLFVKYLDDDEMYGVVKKLIRKKITIITIRQQKKAIEDAALQYVRANLTRMEESELAVYSNTFSHRTDIVKQLQNRLQVVAYNKACGENTIEAYYDFLVRYKGFTLADSADAALARLAPSYYSAFETEAAVEVAAGAYPESPAMQHAAMRQKSRMAYAVACRINTINAFAVYLERYPQGDDYLKALSRIDELGTAEFFTLATPADFADYAEANDDKPFADSAMARLRAMITEDHNVEAARIYLARFPLDPEYSQIYKLYYSWHSAEGNRQPIANFAAENPEYPYRLTIENDLKRGASIDSFVLNKPFVEADYQVMASNIYKLTGKKIAFVALQRILQHQIARKDWAGAKKRLQDFEICFENEAAEEYNELSALLSQKEALRREPLFSAGDMSHVIARQQSPLLYYTSTSAERPGIFYARETTIKKYRSWKPAGKVKVEGAAGPVVAYNFFHGGNRVLLGIDGDIWVAYVVNDTLWRIVERLPSPVNTPAYETDAFMLDDGTGILLASDRKGGQNFQTSGCQFHGDTALATDIYYIPRTALGWGDAVNLGYGVNSAYCERSPILSRNMRTLYFVSDAHGGLGYGDVYQVSRDDIEDWTHWTKPVNLGKVANGAFDESSIAFADRETKLLITSQSSQGGETNCLRIASQHDTASCYHEAKLSLQDLAGAVQLIEVADMSRQEVVETYQGRSTVAVVSLQLCRGKRYVVNVSADDTYIPMLVINDTLTSVRNHTYAVQGFTLAKMVEMKEPLPIEAVRFVVGTSNLLPLAEKELSNLAQFMMRNPSSKVEFIVQVKGNDDKQCYNLSVGRALAIRNAMVEAGVASDRVSISSYGNVNYKNGSNPAEIAVVISE